jgi:hypothetical protein
LDEEVVAFGGRDYGDNGFGCVECFEALSEHHIKVIRINVGGVGKKAENNAVNIGIG